METPDFTGLHGKKLINAHKAWQKRAHKAGASFDKVRYAGLTQEQAVEMHQYYRRVGTTGLILLFSLNLIVFGWATISGWFEGYLPPWHFVGNIITMSSTLLTLIIVVTRVMSVRNKQLARRSYIRSTDERLVNIRRRSGIGPLLLMSYILVMASAFLFLSSPETMSWKITPLVAAGLALCIAGLAQFLIAVTTYLIMRRR